ncbi:MAG: hypothetical protein Q8L55_03555, partial [Phycisphaerales bacterium]|nr:hypothetical protein [Phycisphaerales bacterium]
MFGETGPDRVLSRPAAGYLLALLVEQRTSILLISATGAGFHSDRGVSCSWSVANEVNPGCGLDRGR